MAFTQAELDNIAEAALDYHMKRGQVHSQTIQEKPLYRTMRDKQKTFPGGKGEITCRVKGKYDTDISGYSHNDTVAYGNPANIKTAKYPWKEIHAGIEVTLTELKHDGISVVDSTRSDRTVEHSDREMTVLAGLLQDKLEDMSEGWARGFNNMLWEDGTQDPKEVPGIQSIILDDPLAAVTVGGIDQSVETYWQNRSRVDNTGGTSATDERIDTANTEIARVLSSEYRQLRRFGGNPSLFLCGSDWLDAIEKEMRDKGYYTETGWAKNGGRMDVSAADPAFKNQAMVYDPTLDDLGFAKRAYWIDPRYLFLMVMSGEDMKQHNPARPANQYVFYRAMTWTGGLVANMRNCHGVYEFK